MSGVKIENGQATVLELFDNEIHPNDKFGIVIFNERFHNLIPMTYKS